MSVMPVCVRLSVFLLTGARRRVLVRGEHARRRVLVVAEQFQNRCHDFMMILAIVSAETFITR